MPDTKTDNHTELFQYQMEEMKQISKSLIETLEKTKEYLNNLNTNFKLMEGRVIILENDGKNYSTVEQMTALTEEMKQLKEESRETNKRLGRLEKWRWISGGAITVIVFMALNGTAILEFLGKMIGKP